MKKCLFGFTLEIATLDAVFLFNDGSIRIEPWPQHHHQVPERC